MKCARSDLEVRVNSAHPGSIDTPMLARAAIDLAERRVSARTAVTLQTIAVREGAVARNGEEGSV
jgi:NAD(P)-dependent dehydrogenase (short-subunit alcohol dehydrogenase family)